MTEYYEAACLACSAHWVDHGTVAPTACVSCHSRRVIPKRVYIGPVLVVDQFSGLSPYWLQANPMSFDELVTYAKSIKSGFIEPYTANVDATFKVPYATTVFAPDADGRARVLATRWDSSG